MRSRRTSPLRLRPLAPALLPTDSRRTRWDSLQLCTPAEFCSLLGLPFPGAAGTYPSKDDVAAHLESYADTLDLPVALNTRVRRLTRDQGGVFTAETERTTIRARQVVVATGPFQTPATPPRSPAA